MTEERKLHFPGLQSSIGEMKGCEGSPRGPHRAFKVEDRAAPGLLSGQTHVPESTVLTSKSRTQVVVVAAVATVAVG